jgi:outer membrane protein insertion porin family
MALRLRFGRILVMAGLAVVVSGQRGWADVSDYLEKPIVSVRLEREGRRVTDPRLQTIIETEVGDRLRMSAVRESITHLFSLGRFEDVRVHAAEEGAGVALTYELLPLHPVQGIVFVGLGGAEGVSAGRLRRAITDRFGNAPRIGRAAEMARVIQGELQAAGYPHAAVTLRTDIEHLSERSTLVFSIEHGTRTLIEGIEVVGSFGVPTPELLDRLDLGVGRPYLPEAIRARTAALVDERRGRGFYAARLTVAAELIDSDRRARLTVSAEDGPRVRVVFKGDAWPTERRADLVPIAREGSIDEDLLEDSSVRIEQFLRRLGYRDAKAPFTREETGGEMLITFTITKGPLYRIGERAVTGPDLLPIGSFEPRLRARAGQPYSAEALEEDRLLVEDVYHQQGFATARVGVRTEVLAPPPGGAEVPVKVWIEIAENARTVVGSVRTSGNESVAESELTSPLGLQPGSPFFLTQMALDRDQIQLLYANRGYRNATVEGNPGPSPDGTRADVVFTVREGPRFFVDHILIVGNLRTKTSTIERELQLKPGDPLGLDKVVESQRRLAALGLFRRARITELAHGGEAKRDLVVTVDEAPVTTIGYGGGLEAGQRIRRTEAGGLAREQLEVAPRAFFEIGRRNLFGKNRSINVFSRVGLRPQNASRSIDTPTAAGYGLSEYRLLGTFREPRVWGTTADAFLTGTAEQQLRASFNFARRAFSAEIARRLTPTVSASGSYQIQRTELFDEQIAPADQLLVDRLFPQVRLSSFSSSIIRDTRDDPLDPSVGHYLSANGQIAARRIGSEVGFAKTFLTGQMFRTLPGARRTVVATAVRVGLAAGFQGDAGPFAVDLRDLPASERFFAGGDTTVRGFALDQLATPATIDANGFPIGGNGLVILNAELRIPVVGGFGVVGFFDAGNVFARSSDISVADLRGSVGFGMRYKSPIGPIRIDWGFKLDRLEFASGVREPLTALHISLGQAF